MAQQVLARDGTVSAAGLIRSLTEAGLDVRPIPQAAESTSAGLRRAVARRRGPALFPGLADGWPARTAWAPENLTRTHGHKPVTALMGLPASGVLLPREQRDYERTLPFADFIDSMLTASAVAPCYLAYTRADGLFPATDYDFSGLTEKYAHSTDTRVWIGSAGTRSALHSDLKDNLFCQISGEKLVVLLPWEYSDAAYPFPDNIVNSQIDFADLDLDRFPRLREAVLYAGIVRPGDILFMPRGTWHDVSSLTPSVSVNHWFGPPLEVRRYAALLMRFGPRYWAATAKDFLIHGVLRRPERTVFFFSPPSTGKRLYDLLRWGDFSRDNDPGAG
jgi:hypothetical protein